jgi:hypothetical protein
MDTVTLKEELEKLFVKMTGNEGNTLNFGSKYAREKLLGHIMEIIESNLPIVRD